MQGTLKIGSNCGKILHHHQRWSLSGIGGIVFVPTQRRSIFLLCGTNHLCGGESKNFNKVQSTELQVQELAEHQLVSPDNDKARAKLLTECHAEYVLGSCTAVGPVFEP